MSLFSSLVTVLALCHNVQGEDVEVQIPSEPEVRTLLRADEFKEERRTLIKYETRAFPIYLRILTSKNNVEPMEVGRIFSVLAALKVDRRIFLEHTVARLAHSDMFVRLSAAHLLAQIGSERDAAPVVALLSDRRREVSFAAAKTLAAIGDQRTLTAMNVWLNSGNHRDDAQLLRHVAQCRDALKQRLERQAKARE